MLCVWILYGFAIVSAEQACLLERFGTLQIKYLEVWQAQAGLFRKGKVLCKEKIFQSYLIAKEGLLLQVSMKSK